MNKPYQHEGIAQLLASKGRNGDSTLMHVTPNEVAKLQQVMQAEGKPLTINPETGLPEAFGWDDLNPFKSLEGSGSGATVAGVIGGVIGIDPGVMSLLVGTSQVISSGGDFGKGFIDGLSAYGGAQLGQWGMDAAGRLYDKFSAAADAWNAPPTEKPLVGSSSEIHPGTHITTSTDLSPDEIKTLQAQGLEYHPNASIEWDDNVKDWVSVEPKAGGTITSAFSPSATPNQPNWFERNIPGVQALEDSKFGRAFSAFKNAGQPAVVPGVSGGTGTSGTTGTGAKGTSTFNPKDIQSAVGLATLAPTMAAQEKAARDIEAQNKADEAKFKANQVNYTYMSGIASNQVRNPLYGQPGQPLYIQYYTQGTPGASYSGPGQGQVRDMTPSELAYYKQTGTFKPGAATGGLLDLVKKKSFADGGSTALSDPSALRPGFHPEFYNTNDLTPYFEYLRPEFKAMDWGGPNLGWNFSGSGSGAGTPSGGGGVSFGGSGELPATQQQTIDPTEPSTVVTPPTPPATPTEPPVTQTEQLDTVTPPAKTEPEATVTAEDLEVTNWNPPVTQTTQPDTTKPSTITQPKGTVTAGDLEVDGQPIAGTADYLNSVGTTTQQTGGTDTTAASTTTQPIGTVTPGELEVTGQPSSTPVTTPAELTLGPTGTLTSVIDPTTNDAADVSTPSGFKAFTGAVNNLVHAIPGVQTVEDAWKWMQNNIGKLGNDIDKATFTGASDVLNDLLRIVNPYYNLASTLTGHTGMELANKDSSWWQKTGDFLNDFMRLTPGFALLEDLGVSAYKALEEYRINSDINDFISSGMSTDEFFKSRGMSTAEQDAFIKSFNENRVTVLPPKMYDAIYEANKRFKAGDNVSQDDLTTYIKGLQDGSLSITDDPSGIYDWTIQNKWDAIRAQYPEIKTINDYKNLQIAANNAAVVGALAGVNNPNFLAGVSDSGIEGNTADTLNVHGVQTDMTAPGAAYDAQTGLWYNTDTAFMGPYVDPFGHGPGTTSLTQEELDRLNFIDTFNNITPAEPSSSSDFDFNPSDLVFGGTEPATQPATESTNNIDWSSIDALLNNQDALNAAIDDSMASGTQIASTNYSPNNYSPNNYSPNNYSPSQNYWWENITPASSSSSSSSSSDFDFNPSELVFSGTPLNYYNYNSYTPSTPTVSPWNPNSYYDYTTNSYIDINNYGYNYNYSYSYSASYNYSYSYSYYYYYGSAGGVISGKERERKIERKKRKYANGGGIAAEYYAQEKIPGPEGRLTKQQVIQHFASRGAVESDLYGGLGRGLYASSTLENQGLYAPRTQKEGKGVTDKLPKIKKSKGSTKKSGAVTPETIEAYIAALNRGEDPRKSYSGYSPNSFFALSEDIPSFQKGGEVPLEDGTFIIPADVVSHLGNGSTKGGADLLDSTLFGHSAGGYLLNGDGDGMSDSIPAIIHGEEPLPAAVADGEYVVPANAVAQLGQGSVKRGANKLYDMMDKVRKARTGTTKQAPQTDMKKFIPR